MSNKYFKYLPWMIIGAFSSYGVATHYAQTTFDLFYLTAIFMIVYVALLYLHETYLKYKYKQILISASELTRLTLFLVTMSIGEQTLKYDNRHPLISNYNNKYD